MDDIDGADVSSKISLDENVYLNYKKIDGNIIVKYVNFNNHIQIENCIISGDLILENSEFDYICIKNTTIFGRSSFYKSNFSDSAIFVDSMFKGIANFEDAIFDEVKFDRSEFSEDANFEYCLFDKTSRFNGVIFNKDAVFTQATFNDETFFIEARFLNDAYFPRIIFANDVEFNSAFFSGRVDFYRTQFRRNALFSELISSDEFDFSEADFRGKADFFSSRFGRIVNFHNASFFGILRLNEIRFNQLYLPWKNAKDNLSCDKYLYLYLINSYKEQGLFEDADDCYYYFRDHYPQSYPFSFMIEPILKCLYGWGVKPFNTILSSLFFIAIFGLYFWLVRAPIKADKRSDITGNEYSARISETHLKTFGQKTFILHAKAFSTILKKFAISSQMTALILSAKIFASALTPIISEPSVNGPAGNAAKLEKLLAHVLAALFLIALAKTVLREII